MAADREWVGAAARGAQGWAAAAAVRGLLSFLMWWLDSEFDPRTGEVRVVTVMRVGRPWTVRQWVAGAVVSAVEWLVGRWVLGFGIDADVRVLGLRDVYVRDLRALLVRCDAALVDASLDELVLSNLGLRLRLHGAGVLSLRELRAVGVNSVWAADALWRVIRVRGGVWHGGVWYALHPYLLDGWWGAVPTG